MRPMTLNLCKALCALFAALCSGALIAAPGAHGPNGEHLDGPAGGAAPAHGAPRIEAKSETFELVGRLVGGELTLLINRYETNEPVLAARVEVESGNLKAAAPFRAGQGDYAVADEVFLRAVAQAGSHPIVITVVAGKDADLLEGTLTVKPDVAAHSDGDEHGHSHAGGIVRPLAIVVVLSLLALLGWWLHRGRLRAGEPVGGVQ